MKKLTRWFMVVLLVIVTVMQPMGMKAYAATVPSTTPIQAYTRSTGRVTTYRSVNGSYSGYIDGSTDLCKITEIYDSGWCKVNYPTSRGRKNAYTKTSNFFVNVNFSNTFTTLGKGLTAYRRSSANQRFGSVYASDSVIIVGQENGRTQVIYPVSGGYKLGWVSGSYSANVENVVAIEEGYYQIKSAGNADYVLDVANSSMDDSGNIILFTNHRSLNQGFIIRKQSNGYYVIEAIHSGKVFDASEGGCVNGTNVIQFTYHGGDNQLWKIIKTKDGYVSFVNKKSGLFLDVDGANFANGTNIQLWESNGTGAQKFILESATVDGKGYSGESTNNNSSTKGQQLADTVKAKVGQSYANGYCLKFAEESYQNAGGSRPYHCCASHSGDIYIRSTSKENIPIGATVYFGNCGGGPCRSCGNRNFGHVGIYVGDGKFVHASGGKIQISSLSDSYWSPRYRGYGFLGGFNVN